MCVWEIIKEVMEYDSLRKGAPDCWQFYNVSDYVCSLIDYMHCTTPLHRILPPLHNNIGGHTTYAILAPVLVNDLKAFGLNGSPGDTSWPSTTGGSCMDISQHNIKHSLVYSSTWSAMSLYTLSGCFKLFKYVCNKTTKQILQCYETNADEKVL